VRRREQVGSKLGPGVFAAHNLANGFEAWSWRRPGPLREGRGVGKDAIRVGGDRLHPRPLRRLLDDPLAQGLPRSATPGPSDSALAPAVSSAVADTESSSPQWIVWNRGQTRRQGDKEQETRRGLLVFTVSLSPCLLSDSSYSSFYYSKRSSPLFRLGGEQNSF